jgi:HSP20 family molecular chaperone IbpA
MVRVTALTSPLLLGFDDLERALDKVSKTGTDGYPPYNIERVAANGDAPEKLRITLAVAGFSQDRIEVTVEENQLTIRGRQQEDKAREYLHRGIAARQFQRGFLLADGMRVLSARARARIAFGRSRPAATRAHGAKDTNRSARLRVASRRRA